MGPRRWGGRARDNQATDDDDLSLLASGDADAFTALFRRHNTFVYNLAFRRTASWSAAEDITERVFLELWRQRAHLETSGGSLAPWLAGVARNLARHWWRAGTRQAGAVRRLALVCDVGGPSRSCPDDADDVASRVDDERRMAVVLGYIDELPEAQREVLMLWAWEQFTYEEIAEAVGAPVGTVRSRLSRARASLRAVEGTERGPRASTTEPPDRAVVAFPPEIDEGGCR